MTPVAEAMSNMYLEIIRRIGQTDHYIAAAEWETLIKFLIPKRALLTSVR